MTGKLKKVLLEKLLRIAQGFTEAFASLWLSLHPLDLLMGVAGAALVRLAVYLKAKNAKKYRRGVEYGSARWGRPEDIAPYIDPVPDWNIPLTRTESLTMTSRPKDPKTARNKYPGHRRLRQRQDKVLCQAVPAPNAQLLCGH